MSNHELTIIFAQFLDALVPKKSYQREHVLHFVGWDLLALHWKHVGVMPSEHGKQGNACRPDIDRCVLGVLIQHDLRGHVAACSVSIEYLALLLELEESLYERFLLINRSIFDGV